MTRFKKAGYFGGVDGNGVYHFCFLSNREIIVNQTNPKPSRYGIFTYIWLFLMVKYGFHVYKYTSPMDAMGIYHAMIWMGSSQENWIFVSMRTQ